MVEHTFPSTLSQSLFLSFLHPPPPSLKLCYFVSIKRCQFCVCVFPLLRFVYNVCVCYWRCLFHRQFVHLVQIDFQFRQLWIRYMYIRINFDIDFSNEFCEIIYLFIFLFSAVGCLFATIRSIAVCFLCFQCVCLENLYIRSIFLSSSMHLSLYLHRLILFLSISQ